MMERENFYILLQLPYDPPETDPQVIEAVIAKKQSEWSRLRNHPIRGLHAQKCINMIPEIRRVMGDEALRAREAEAAKQLSAKDREGKFPEIDRHIDILMGKGHITGEEILKLAQVHDLEEGEIRERINARKNVKYHRIDQQITLRMAKGFLTETEVEQIARRNAVKAEEVRKRVRCPIVKNGKKSDIAPPKQMDRSLEKTIQDNLKLLGKSSLYDFLGLPESADLKSLQEAAARRKKQAASTSKKDAVATATNTLAGHCATIFKSDESRNAYDVSLAKAKLSELDSDIDIAGISGKLRPEYFEILVNKAVDFGMEKKEAERYIKNYCKRKKWSIQTPPDKRRRNILAAASVFGLAAILVVAGILYVNIEQQRARQADFDRLMQNVDQQVRPGEKMDLLKNYIAAHRADEAYGSYVDKARSRMDAIRRKMAESGYQDLKAEVEARQAAGKYAEAIELCRQYASSGVPEAFAGKAENMIDELRKQLETSEFEKLRNLMVSGTPPEKIEAVTAFLEKYPSGQRAKEAKKMLAEMSKEYSIYIREELEKCESAGHWERCARLCESYISRYDNSDADHFRKRLAGYREKIEHQRIFQALRQKAAVFGTRYAAAIDVYEDFLSAYPQTPIADRVRKEITRLRGLARKNEIEDAKQAFRDLLARAGNDRFVEKTDGVLLDSQTGLMWQMLDTGVTRPEECFTYERARQYVDGLNAGGYTDWRLPTPKELAGIYKTPPYFPAMGQKWYWTSESFSSYSEGWHRVVETIDNRHRRQWQPEQKDSRECGTVRAVREAR